MAEYNNNTSAWDTQYTYGYDLLDKQGSGGTEFPFYDGMGDVFQTLSASGSYVLSDDISDDFGQHFVAASGTDDLSYKWRASSGYRWDGDGLWAGNHMEPIVEVGARYYIPAMGVFITRDKDLGQRPYEYCYADAANFVDPDGASPVSLGAPSVSSALVTAAVGTAVSVALGVGTDVAVAAIVGASVTAAAPVLLGVAVFALAEGVTAYVTLQALRPHPVLHAQNPPEGDFNPILKGGVPPAFSNVTPTFIAGVTSSGQGTSSASGRPWWW